MCRIHEKSTALNIFKQCEVELSKEEVDYETFLFVEKFWNIEEELPCMDLIMDRIELLESRLLIEKNWEAR